jgi:hypothetical protein
MPEVIEQAKRRSLKKEEFGDLSWGTGICIQPCPSKPMPVIEFDREATVLSILNRIAASHPGLIWWYWENVCGGDPEYVLYMPVH